MTGPDTPPPRSRRGAPEGSARLVRSSAGLLGGVASGVASFVGARPMTLRLLFLVLIVLSAGIFGLIYGLLWVLLPRE